MTSQGTEPKSESLPSISVGGRTTVPRNNGRPGWLAAGFLGAALIFNPYVIPSEAEGSPRLTDLVSVLLAVILLIRWVTGYRYAVRFPAALWVVLGLVLIWLGREWFVGGSFRIPIRLDGFSHSLTLTRFIVSRPSRTHVHLS